MILYHGSFLEIAEPDLIHSRLNVGFGRGFYTNMHCMSDAYLAEELKQEYQEKH